MAKLTSEDVLKLARLARLSLQQDEVTKYQSEISAILGYVEQLSNVEANGLEPTSQVTGLTDVMREDIVVDYGVSQAELLKNAPANEDGHIKVRKML
jgi:aspartyl-tRNA(Asn)/glutamyl-tRNA(Gln) amidotransferase subunit C